MTIQPGQSIQHYQILEKLGEGGMATVFKAYDTRLERQVAVKVIQCQAFSPEILGRVLKRFEREAKGMARLTQPNIVGIIDYGEYEGFPYLVMPYLPGGTLKEFIAERRLSWQKAVGLLLPITRALAYAHSEGFVHRDVKPSNILFTATGDPMLSDFGIAKLVKGADEGTALTGTGVGIGTPEYMAPEQALGKKVDARADIYSLGVVFFEMVTGQLPYEADSPMAISLKHVADPLPRLSQLIPDLPDAVEQVLTKALAKQPQDRYEDMNAFTKALERLLAASNLVTGEIIALPRKASSPWRWLGIGLVGLFLLVLGFYGVGSLVKDSRLRATPNLPVSQPVILAPTATNTRAVLAPTATHTRVVPSATPLSNPLEQEAVAGCTVVSFMPTPGPTEVSLFPPVNDQDWTLGPREAAITIFEYSDFQ